MDNRTMQIARLVREGMSLAGIARALGLKRSTVSAYHREAVKRGLSRGRPIRDPLQYLARRGVRNGTMEECLSSLTKKDLDWIAENVPKGSTTGTLLAALVRDARDEEEEKLSATCGHDREVA